MQARGPPRYEDWEIGVLSILMIIFQRDGVHVLGKGVSRLVKLARGLVKIYIHFKRQRRN